MVSSPLGPGRQTATATTLAALVARGLGAIALLVAAWWMPTTEFGVPSAAAAGIGIAAVSANSGTKYAAIELVSTEALRNGDLQYFRQRRRRSLAFVFSSGAAIAAWASPPLSLIGLAAAGALVWLQVSLFQAEAYSRLNGRLVRAVLIQAAVELPFYWPQRPRRHTSWPASPE